MMGERQARCLGGVLRVGGLVGGRVGHGHGAAVHDLDAPPLPQPRVRGLLVQRAAAVAGQPDEEGLGQACAGLAVGVSLGGAGALALSDEPGEHTGDGGAAGAVGADDLAEEGPQGEHGGEDDLTPGGALLVEGLLEVVSGEQVGEGESVGESELVCKKFGKIVWRGFLSCVNYPVVSSDRQPRLTPWTSPVTGLVAHLSLGHPRRERVTPAG
jgi:hypothetical protein